MNMFYTLKLFFKIFFRNPKRGGLLFFLSFFPLFLSAQQTDVLLKAGDRQVSIGNFALAEKLYQKARAQGANKAVISFKLGNVYFRQNDIPKAIAGFQETIKAAPYFKNAYANLATMYYKLEEYALSIEILKKYLNINPEDSETLILLGSVYKKIRAFTLAEKCFETAGEINPDLEDSYLELAYIYIDLGDYNRAEAFINEGITSVPESYMLRETLAQIQKMQGHYKQSANTYAIILNQTPGLTKDDRYYYNCEMCDAFIEGGLTNIAISKLKSSVRMLPRKTRAIELLKFVYLSTGRLMEGLDFFKEIYPLNRLGIYKTVKDLFTMAYNTGNTMYINEFIKFYEENGLTNDELYIFVKGL